MLARLAGREVDRKRFVSERLARVAVSIKTPTEAGGFVGSGACRLHPSRLEREGGTRPRVQPQCHRATQPLLGEPLASAAALWLPGVLPGRRVPPGRSARGVLAPVHGVGTRRITEVPGMLSGPRESSLPNASAALSEPSPRKHRLSRWKTPRSLKISVSPKWIIMIPVSCPRAFSFSEWGACVKSTLQDVSGMQSLRSCLEKKRSGPPDLRSLRRTQWWPQVGRWPRGGSRNNAGV